MITVDLELIIPCTIVASGAVFLVYLLLDKDNT